MQKIPLFLGLLLVISGCRNVHHRLGVIADEKKETEPLTCEAWFEAFVDATDNNVETVDETIKQGAQNNFLGKATAWEDDQYTSLHYAAQAGKLAVVKALVQQSDICVDIRTGNYQRTPLHLVALEGHKDVVSFW